MSGNRKTVLAHLVRENSWRIGAELGLWQGELSAYLLANCPDLCLIGIDHWEASGSGDKDKATGNAPYAGKDMAAAEARTRAAVAPYGSRVEIMKMSTTEAANHVSDESLDFVFIDASHDTESVLADIRAWRPKVRGGGALIGHDANWPSVTAALNEEVPGWTLMDGNVWFRWK